jgi:hypothetical protein
VPPCGMPSAPLLHSLAHLFAPGLSSSHLCLQLTGLGLQGLQLCAVCSSLLCCCLPCCLGCTCLLQETQQELQKTQQELRDMEQHNKEVSESPNTCSCPLPLVLTASLPLCFAPAVLGLCQPPPPMLTIM